MGGQQVTRDLTKWGMRYSETIIIKTDQENAILDVSQAVAKQRSLELGPTARTLVEHSPKGESSSNGFIEAGVRSIEGLARSLWFSLLANLGQRSGSSSSSSSSSQGPLSIQGPMIAWIAEHAADLLTKKSPGPDGLTPWQRLKTKAYRGEMTYFGAQVLH